MLMNRKLVTSVPEGKRVECRKSGSFSWNIPGDMYEGRWTQLLTQMLLKATT